MPCSLCRGKGHNKKTCPRRHNQNLQSSNRQHDPSSSSLATLSPPSHRALSQAPSTPSSNSVDTFPSPLQAALPDSDYDQSPPPSAPQSPASQGRVVQDGWDRKHGPGPHASVSPSQLSVHELDAMDHQPQPDPFFPPSVPDVIQQYAIRWPVFRSLSPTQKRQLQADVQPLFVELLALEQQGAPIEPAIGRILQIPANHLRQASSFQAKNNKNREQGRADAGGRNIAQAIALVSSKKTALAVKSLTSLPPVPLTEETLQTLLTRTRLHEPAEDAAFPELPPDAPRVASIVNRHMLAILRRAAQNSNALDLQGWCLEILKRLYEVAQIREGLNVIFLRLINGTMPPSLLPVFLARKQIALDTGKGDIRAVTWGSMFMYLATAYVRRLSGLDFLPYELGLGAKGGTTRALVVANLAVRLSDHHAVFKVDIEKAYPSTDRAAAIRDAYATEQFRPMFRLLDAAFRDGTDILTFDPGKARYVQHAVMPSGLHIGDTASTALFVNHVGPAVRAGAAVQHCTAVSIQDDITLLGPADHLPTAARALRDALPQEYTLNATKSYFVWPRSSPVPEVFYQEVEAMGMRVHDRAWASLVGGVVSTFDSVEVIQQVQQFLLAKLKRRYQALWDTVARKEMHAQTSLLIITKSIFPRIHHLLRALPPAVLAPITEWFDAEIVQAVKKVCGLKSQELTQLQCLQLQAKPKAGGFNLPKTADISALAYVAGAADAAEDVYERFRGAENELPRLHGLDAAVAVTRDLVEANPVDVHGGSSRIHVLPPEASLPDEATDFWPHFGALGGKLRVYMGALSNSERAKAKLQASYTASLSDSTRHQLFAEAAAAGDRVQVRLAAAAAGMPMFVGQIPSAPLFKIGNDEFRAHAQLVLGQPLFERIPGTCICAGGEYELTAENFNDHLLSCKRLTCAKISRHDGILAVAHAEAGKMAIVSRSHLQLPYRPSVSNPGRKVRADQWLYNPDADQRDVETDVTVGHPGSDGEIVAQALNSGHCLSRLEKGKILKHEQTSAAHDAEFVPVAMTTYGGFGPKGQRFFDFVGQHASRNFPLDFPEHQMFEAHLKAGMFAALVRGNHRVVASAYNTLSRLNPVALPRSDRLARYKPNPRYADYELGGDFGDPSDSETDGGGDSQLLSIITDTIPLENLPAEQDAQQGDDWDSDTG